MSIPMPKKGEILSPGIISNPYVIAFVILILLLLAFVAAIGKKLLPFS